MAQVKVTVVIADDADVEAVAAAATAAGLRVEHAMAEVGIIAGDIDEALIARLTALPGVASVERGQSVSIAPPDSPVQ